MSIISDFLAKTSTLSFKDSIKHAFHELDFAKIETALKSLFASIPYNLFTNNKMYEYEGYFVSVFYAYIKALGIELVAEDATNKGRIDLTIKLPKSIFVIEFKTDGTNALSQIKAKKYHEKYMSEQKNVYLMGVEFDTKERNVSKVEFEEVL